MCLLIALFVQQNNNSWVLHESFHSVKLSNYFDKNLSK